MLFLCRQFSFSNKSVVKFCQCAMSEVNNVSHLRAPYKCSDDIFSTKNLASKDPFQQFENWYKIARNTPEIIEPHSMTLATVKKNGRPAARTVLLKGHNKEGFVFFTNNLSAKASDLETTPYASLVFYWTHLSRSIRVEGFVEKLSRQVTEEYFFNRPKVSQLASLVSPHQSSPVESREVLRKRLTALEEEYKDESPPCPTFASAYIVKPNSFEFWQGQSSRMHDRIRFLRKEDSLNEKFLHEGENGWVYQTLEP